MNLKDLLLSKDVNPERVLVLRHRAQEPELHKVLPWLAADSPAVFNAYQQSQTLQVEREMERAEHVAAFIGHEPGKALFVGLYSVENSRPITPKEYSAIPENAELERFGHRGFAEQSPRHTILWFDLELTAFYADWKGKLIVRWPPLDRNWHRWAHRPNNEMPVLAILEDSALDAVMPEWHAIDFTWEQLAVLPKLWKLKLGEWRGIYYIFDMSDSKGYVGSASGESNLLGRWKDYAASGHGGNRLLRKRDPRNFRFSILQRVSPDAKTGDVNEIENSWKVRLHTKHPHGLNDN